jgi:hypothetical protein
MSKQRFPWVPGLLVLGLAIFWLVTQFARG